MPLFLKWDPPLNPLRNEIGGWGVAPLVLRLPWVRVPPPHEKNTAVQTCNPSTWEVKKDKLKFKVILNSRLTWATRDPFSNRKPNEIGENPPCESQPIDVPYCSADQPMVESLVPKASGNKAGGSDD